MTVLYRREPLVNGFNLLHQLQRNINATVSSTSNTNPESQNANSEDASRQETKRKLNNKWVPNVDISEQPNQFILKIDIPGVDPKTVDLTVEQGYLTITGIRKQTAIGNDESQLKVECLYGDFSRQFKLPDTTETESISAKGAHGVLEVIIPKTKKAEPRKIQIVH